MKQVSKFYLASFLKNQIYFVPIIVLFFQDIGLSFAQIFWIFTIGAVFSFIIEIPTGIIADRYGNRKSIIFSKLLIFISFLFFGFASSFIALIIANLIYELGKSFRSGTETAYVYNYLAVTPGSPSYTRVKINQKFYARISESAAALLGGFIAYQYGFSVVFFIAAIPALINFFQTLSWERLKAEEGRVVEKFKFVTNAIFIKQAFKDLMRNKVVLKIILNIAIFSASFAALDKFIQPYMKNSGIDLQHFGLIYAVSLIIVAFVVKFAAKLEKKWGGEKIMNYSSFIAVAALIILSYSANSLWLVGLFFFVLMVDNLRSPVANNLFHEQISSDKRATMGSILELIKSANKLWLLPLIGYMADIYSMKVAMFIIAIIILINTLLLWISGAKKEEILLMNNT